jgi:hypothetical protein
VRRRDLFVLFFGGVALWPLAGIAQQRRVATVGVLAVGSPGVADFWPLSLERGQPYRRAKDFPAPNRRATDGRRIPPLLKLTMPFRLYSTRRAHPSRPNIFCNRIRADKPAAKSRPALNTDTG